MEARDTATAERLQHAVMVRDIAGGRDTARQEIKDSYLDIWRDHWTPAQFNAGDQLRKRWYHSRMVALGSIDYSEPHVSGGGNSLGSIYPASESRENSRMIVRNALRVLGNDGPAFVTIQAVIDEVDPQPIVARLTKRKDKAQCRAVAVEFMKLGLDRLVKLWGLDGRR